MHLELLVNINNYNKNDFFFVQNRCKFAFNKLYCQVQTLKKKKKFWKNNNILFVRFPSILVFACLNRAITFLSWTWIIFFLYELLLSCQERVFPSSTKFYFGMEIFFIGFAVYAFSSWKSSQHSRYLMIDWIALAQVQLNFHKKFRVLRLMTKQYQDQNNRSSMRCKSFLEEIHSFDVSISFIWEVPIIRWSFI